MERVFANGWSVMRPALGLCFLVMLSFAAGCAGFGSGREAPTVSLQSLRAVPAQGGGLPSFEIGLVVLNPNPEPLRLQGLVYSVELNGQPVLDGVSNELPVVEGYGRAEVTLNATVNMLGGIRLFNSLLRGDDGIDYAFEARLDPEGFARDIRVTQSGRLDASSLGR